MDDDISRKILKRIEQKDILVDKTFKQNDINLIIQELDIYHAELIAQNEELIENQKKLEESREEFFSLFFESPIPYLIVNNDLVIEKFNVKADEFFSIIKKKNIKNNIIAFIDSTYVSAFLSWVKNNEYTDDIEILMKCKNGLKKRFKLKAINHPSKSYLFLALIDIDEEYKLKKNLELKVEEEVSKNVLHLKMLQEQSKLASMGELIDIIIHQWMNPLSVIKLRTEILMHDVKSKKLKLSKIENYVDEQIATLDYLTTTLKNFRNFLRPNENLESTNLKNLLDNIVVLLNESLILKKIKLIIDVDKNLVVRVFPNDFLHIFVNLINNSIEAFDEKNIKNGFIKIFTVFKNGREHICFEDNAGGIANDKIEKIFDKNFTTKKTGTGIGLYLIKIILDKLEADIKVENINGGCKFTIII